MAPARCDGEVLGCGDCEVVPRIITLKTGHVCHAHTRSEERIFAVSLLPGPSAGRGRCSGWEPKIETSHDAGVALAQILHVLDAAFDADLSSHGVNTLRVEGSCETDWFGISVTPSLITPWRASLHH